VSQNDNEPVANNAGSTEKLLGGVTGKGFMPGQSGNPSGRPKTKPVSDRLRHALESGDADVVTGLLLEGAKKGDLAFIKEILDRVEGKPIATSEISGPDGGPIDATIEIVLVRPDENGVS
jgi:hypothetical protein